MVCDVEQECGSEPRCFTDFEPRYSGSGDGGDDLGGSLSSQLDSHNPNPNPIAWSLNVSFFDAKAVETAKKLGRGYVDKKNVFLSNSNTTALTMKIKVSRNSSIWICELQKGFLKYPSTLGELDQEAVVTITTGIHFL